MRNIAQVKNIKLAQYCTLLHNQSHLFESLKQMLSFRPDLKLEKALKELQGRMVETGAGLASIPPAERQYLNKCALISNVGASTRIENAVLTDVEIEWVDTTLSENGKTTAFEEKKGFILDKLSKDRERSIEEVIGCRDVLNTVYQQGQEFFPLTEATLRGLHHDLLRHYPRTQHYVGQYKRNENRVISTNSATGEQQTVLEPAAPASRPKSQCKNWSPGTTTVCATTPGRSW